MKNFIIIFIALLPLSAYSQGKGSKRIVVKHDNSIEEFYIKKDTPGIKHGLYFKMTKNRITIEKGQFKDNKKEGEWEEKLQHVAGAYSIGSYSNGIKVGVWKYYLGNKINQVFDHDNMKVIKPNTLANEAVYIGGATMLFKYLSDFLGPYYPKDERKVQEYKVYVNFKVNNDGEVIEAKVIKTENEKFNQLAIKAVNNIPARNWLIPKSNYEEPTSFNLPIVFKEKLR